LSATSRVSSQRLRDQLQKLISAGKFRSISSDTTKFKIDKLSKIGGGISNDIYGFRLAYPEGNGMKEVELVLKVYIRNAFEKCRNEGSILKSLESKNFPVPYVYAQEMNEFLGAPFIIMERVNGKPMSDYLKKMHKEERFAFIERFVEILTFLHGLRWEELGLDFLDPPKDEFGFAKKQANLLRNLQKIWGIEENFDWIIEWVEANALLHPCHHYSLIHGDMNLGNFLVNSEGKFFIIDWEHPSIGDALRDVSLAYHNIRLIFGTRNIEEGNEMGTYFIQKYIERSNRTFDSSTLRFYLLSTALQEALSYRFNSSRVLNPFFVKRLLGMKYVPAFPFVWQHFRSRYKYLERFLTEELVK
jgi:aminoglycoside phosphotransferase (APT) family kinase protein